MSKGHPRRLQLDKATIVMGVIAVALGIVAYIRGSGVFLEGLKSGGNMFIRVFLL